MTKNCESQTLQFKRYEETVKRREETWQQIVSELRCGRDTLQRCVEGDENISEETHENDDELHAWCILEERDHDQWQEVRSKQS